MGRPAKNQPTRRLNLEMTEDVRQRLERLRMETQADSLTEVIRRALALYDLIVTERARGEKMVFKGAKGAEREVVLF